MDNNGEALIFSKFTSQEIDPVTQDATRLISSELYLDKRMLQP